VRKKKRTISETETHRVLIVRRRSIEAYSEGFGRNVQVITVERAAEALGISRPALRERIAKSKRNA
jgi:hypothetical protein